MSEQIGRVEGVMPLRSSPVADLRRDSEPFQAARQQTLGGLASEYVFFTTGLLLTGGFDRDPLAEYSRIIDAQLGDYLLVMDFEQVLFPGLPLANFENAGGYDRIDYSRRLYGIPQEKWLPLREFISQLTWFYDASTFAAVSGWAVCSIPDVTSASVIHPLPRVDYVYFAAITTFGTIAFTLLNPHGLPKAVVGPVEQRAMEAAALLLSKKEIQ